MSESRSKLIDGYLKHYQRVNINYDPNAAPDSANKEKDLMFGPYLKSLPNESNVLDVGCGTGDLLNWLSTQPTINPVGVDLSTTQVEAAKKALPNLEIHNADGLEFLKSRPNQFSAIFCMDVLEHIPGHDLLFEWMEAIRNALMDDGLLICRMPNGANLTASYSRYIDLTHERCFTSTSIFQLFESTGFRDYSIIPFQSSKLTGRLRLWVEYSLHRAVFLIAGRGVERHFTRNIQAIGYKA